VHAGDSVVRAVGTAFEVRVLTDQRVDVVVNEGRVEVQTTSSTPVSQNSSAHAHPATTVRALNAGERLAATGYDYAVVPITAQQLSSELAWREGAIIFDAEPLSEAIAEIERYTDARIVVSDPEIAALRVGGRFRTGDVQEFFDALQSALPVSIRHTDAGVVFIDPRR
jgi:transmembrane sensor